MFFTLTMSSLITFLKIESSCIFHKERNKFQEVCNSELINIPICIYMKQKEEYRIKDTNNSEINLNIW